MTDLRVGLIGYGHAGSVFHAPLIAATRGLHLAAIVTTNSERAERAFHTYPSARIVGTADELWVRPGEIDVVVVASPNKTHVPLTLAALAAGIAVVVDKPMAATAADASRLVDEAGARGVPLTVFHNRRWDGDFLTLRRLLQEDKLGHVLRFESRFERWRPAPRGGWRELGAAEEAGGLLYDLGTHLIDQALTLFGPVEQVYAEIDRRRPGVAVDDDVFVALTHASGVRSHLWTTVMAGTPGPRFRVLGSRAAFTKYGMDVQEDALRAGARPTDADWGAEPAERWGLLGADDNVQPVPTTRGAYQQFYRELVDALRTDAPTPVDPLDAVAVLEVIELARRSAADAGPVAADGGEV
jgi:predicted dehydrogenase